MSKIFSSNDKKRVARYAILGLILALSAVLQNSIGIMLPNSNFRLYLMVCVVVSIAMLESEVSSVIFGMIGGMCIDLFSPVHMGYNAVILAIIGLFTSMAVSHFLRSTIFTNILFTGLAIIAYSGLYWLFFVVFGNVENGFKTLFSIFIPNSLTTWIVSPFVYIIVRSLRKLFVEKTDHISF